MHAQDLLDAFTVSAGIPALILSDEGTVRLRVERETVVDIEYEQGREQLHLHVSLGLLPYESREWILHEALSANFFGQGTGGAVVALDRHQEELLLIRTLPLAHADPQSLLRDIETLVEYARELQKQFQNAPVRRPAGSSLDGDASSLTASTGPMIAV